MSTIVGIVEDVYLSGPKSGAKGTYYQASVTLNGVRYGAFLNKGVRPAEKGDKVEFEASQKGQYWNYDPKTFRVLEKGAVKTTGGEAPSGSGGKDAIIVRQNALSHATNLVTSLIGDVGDLETASELAPTAAKLIVKLAATYYTPYSLEGVVPGTTQAAAKPAVDEDFQDDDLPF